MSLVLAHGAGVDAGCKSGPADTGAPVEPPRTEPHAPSPAPQKGAPSMTDLDPSSPEAWKQAEALAAAAAPGKLSRRSAALPFLFTAEGGAAVLVHRGEVVRDRGAKAAGAYLRDLGVIMGKVPAIDDALAVLAALAALPPITDVPSDRFVHAPGDAALADVTARLEFDGVTATVTLTYFLGPPTPPKGTGAAPAPGDVGAREPGYKPSLVRPIARCTLTIPKAGDAAWKVERLSRAG